MKCSKGHEMQATQKHCGECGSKPAEEMRKCAACSGQFLKAFNFCPECGVEAGDGTIDMDAAIAELDAFTKAREAIGKDLFTALPVVPDDAGVNEEAVQAILKAATIKGADGHPDQLDAEPVLEHLIADNQRLAARLDTFSGHMLKAVAHIATDNERLLKANLTLMGQVKGLTTQVKEYLANPRSGRKGITAVTPILKGRTDTPGGKEPAELENPFGDLGEVRGHDLMAKAVLAGRGGFLKSQHIAALEPFTNGNLSLVEVHAQHDELAAIVARGIEASKQQAGTVH